MVSDPKRVCRPAFRPGAELAHQNAVITTEQRTNAAAILRRISDWLEQAAGTSESALKMVLSIIDRQEH
jgi:hypothetical protein